MALPLSQALIEQWVSITKGQFNVRDIWSEVGIESSEGKDHLRKINLDSRRLSAHSLRHTAITLCLKGGATIDEARLLGRHSNINVTLIYAHNLNRVKDAPERKIDAVLQNGFSNGREAKQNDSDGFI